MVEKKVNLHCLEFKVVVYDCFDRNTNSDLLNWWVGQKGNLMTCFQLEIDQSFQL